MAKDKCIHNYIEASNSSSRKVINGDTHNMRTLYCTKCADTKIITVSIWENFIPDKNKGKSSSNEDF